MDGIGWDRGLVPRFQDDLLPDREMVPVLVGDVGPLDEPKDLSLDHPDFFPIHPGLDSRSILWLWRPKSKRPGAIVLITRKEMLPAPGTDGAAGENNRRSDFPLFSRASSCINTIKRHGKKMAEPRPGEYHRA
jgi:hypothetical protein